MKKKRGMVLALIIALLVVAGAGIYTYARYQTSRTGNGTVTIAKWAAVVKQGGSEVSNNFNLTLTPVANSNVASGKVAPGSSATATLVLDLTGTEVVTDYEVEIGDVSGLPDGMTVSSVTAVQDSQAVTLTQSGSKYTGQVALADVSKPITFTITVTWENSDSAARITSDTTAGEAAGTKTVPVIVTAKQHIGA